jgi:hypothetical protein
MGEVGMIMTCYVLFFAVDRCAFLCLSMHDGHMWTARTKPRPVTTLCLPHYSSCFLGINTRITGTDTNTNTTAISYYPPDSRRNASDMDPSPVVQVEYHGPSATVAHAGRGTGAGASVRLPPCRPGGGGRNMGRYVTARDITGSSCVSRPPKILTRPAYMTSPRKSSRACRCSFATPRSRPASSVRCRRPTPCGR